MVSDAMSRAWSVFSKDMGAWIIYGLVFIAVASVLGSVLPVVGGLALLPLAMRETLAAVEQERSPEIAGMFQMQRLGDDFLTALFMVVAQGVGLLFCGVGWFVAWGGFFFAPELAADSRVSAMDAMRLSWRYVSSNLGASMGVALLGLLLTTVGASFVIGLVFTVPLVLVRYACHWLQVRDQVYAQAEASGIRVAPSLTA